MIDGEVGLLEDRSKLKLVGGNLIVTCLARNTEFEGTNLKILHEGLYTIGDSSEIVVFHLLVLGRVVTHQGAACQEEVGTCRIQALVNEEVLLLPTEVALHLLNVIVEILAHVGGSYVNGMESAKQRSLIVECLTSIRDKDGGDTECIVDDEHWRCRIPGRITAGLESVTDTTRWERRSVGLLLNEQFAAEFLNHTALEVMLDE